MADVEETSLPGVGVRYDFPCRDGTRLGVITRYEGERDLVVYDSRDPDRARVSLRLSDEDASTLIDLLGGSQVSQRLDDLQDQIEDLSMQWVSVEAADVAGTSMADSQIRARTGAHVLAVARGDETFAAPRPDFVLERGDRVFVMGTSEAVTALIDLVR